MDSRRGSMYAILMLVLFTFSGCHAPGMGDTRSVATLAPPTETGPKVAEHLQRRFDDQKLDCEGRPSVLCSGVLMRGTQWSTGFHSWIPNPATSAGGVSFSWLRWDSNFPKTIYGNGFIVYPFFFADESYFYHLYVNCGYVVNAATGSLPDKCRVPCHQSSVFTATQWLAKYPSGYGCAFKIAPGDAAPNPATAWMQIAEVRKARSIFSWNEIIVAPWPSNTHTNMPLEAFYYTLGDLAGLNNARNDQRDFRTTAGRWVPIIRWAPASTISGRATFTYNTSDQAILN